MALVVEDKFVDKYREQFYTGEKTVQELNKQQKQLFKILDDLHAKTNQYFDKLCAMVQKRGGQSTRCSVSKQNAKLPVLVDAQIKNTQTYRQVLENQRNNLEKRMAVTANLREKDMNEEIKLEKQKVISTIKKNKMEKLEIKRLGDKLTEEKKSPKQIYDQILTELQTKRKQNEIKLARIQSNQLKISELSQKRTQIDYLLAQKIENFDSNQQEEDNLHQKTLKLEADHKTLSNNRDKLKQNLQSLKTRLSQEYYCKLKQLQGMVKKNQQLDSDMENTRVKIQQKNIQLANHKCLA